MTRKALFICLTLSTLLLCTFVALYIGLLSKFISTQARLEVNSEQVNAMSVRIARVEGITQSISNTDILQKINETTSQSKEQKDKIIKLESEVSIIKKDLRVNLSDVSSIDKRYILFLSYLIKVEQDLSSGVLLHDDMLTLLKLSEFDGNLKDFILKIVDKKQINTSGELANEYKKVARRISSAIYLKQKKYIRAFFAKHFYLTKSGANLDYINTLFEQKNLNKALIEIQGYIPEIDKSDYLDNYIERLETHVLFYKAISDIHSYIFRRFAN